MFNNNVSFSLPHILQQQAFLLVWTNAHKCHSTHLWSKSKITKAPNIAPRHHQFTDRLGGHDKHIVNKYKTFCSFY